MSVRRRFGLRKLSGNEIGGRNRTDTSVTRLMGRDARFRQYYSVCIRSNRGHADPSVTGVFDTSLIRRRPRVSRVPVQIRPSLSSFNTTANGRPSQTSPSIRRKTVTFRTDTRFVRWYRLTHDRIRLRRVCVWGGNIFEFKPFVSALRIRIIVIGTKTVIKLRVKFGRR